MVASSSLIFLILLMFCQESADRAVHFVEKYCQWVEGSVAKTPIDIHSEPWALEIYNTLFGTLKADGSRQYTKAGLFVPRKNAKTTLFAAPIGLKLLLDDDEEGAQIFACARSKEQASISWNIAKRMVQLSHKMRSVTEIHKVSRTISFPRMNSFWKAIPREALASEGLHPSGVIFDDLHTQADDTMYDAMDTGAGNRRQPLFLWISTAGDDPGGVCQRELAYAKQVRDGVIHDPSYISWIWEKKKGDDWKNPKVWRDLNPASFRSMDELEKKFRRALFDKRKELTFRKHFLNEFTGETIESWLNLDVWKGSSGEVDESELIGRKCWTGLDLSSTTDLTAIVHVFMMDDGTLKVLPRIFCPEENLTKRSERDKAMYEQWADQDLLLLTPGSGISYERVKEMMLEDAEKFTIAEVVFDPAMATHLAEQLEAEGLEMLSHRQGSISMNDPMMQCERLLLNKKLHHGDHDVLTWMFVNTAKKEDGGRLCKPVKAQKNSRIDGIVSMIMAVGRVLSDAYEDKAGWEDDGEILL